MGRVVALAYAGVAYALFLGSFAALFLFVGDISFFGFATVDRGPPAPLAEALARDVGWFVAFGLQHSVMARGWFKERFTSRWPAVERAHYVVASALMLGLLFHVWRAVPFTLWDVTASPWRETLLGTYFAGWLLLVASSFFIDHFAMFGLRQAWDAFRGSRSVERPFATPALYRWVRHPIYVGFLVLFWATPKMTVGHAVLAGGMTLYILVGMRLEERDLVRHFGDDYRAYRASVPALVPMPGRKARR